MAGSSDVAAGRPAPITDVPARCSACLAAPVAPPSLADNGADRGSFLANYGTVVLYKSDGWDAKSAQNIEDALALLPDGLRSQLGNPALGPVLVVVNDQGRTISGKQPYGQAANFFSTSEDKSQVVLYPDQPVHTVLHELGHAYNLRHTPGGSYGQAYLDPELQDFMRAVGWRVLTPADQLGAIRDQAKVDVALDGVLPWTDLSRNDPLEDFANSFAMYFATPNQLQQLSPARYDWFSGHFGP